MKVIHRCRYFIWMFRFLIPHFSIFLITAPAFRFMLQFPIAQHVHGYTNRTDEIMDIITIYFATWEFRSRPEVYHAREGPELCSAGT